MLDKFAKPLINVGTGDGSVNIPQTNASAVTGILNTVYFWAAIVAVIVIVVAAYRFVTANGNSSQVAQARMGIIAAVTGLILISSAFAITNFVIKGF